MSPMRMLVPVNYSAHIEDEIAALHERIALRAYEKFLGRGQTDGCDLEDWFTAEADLIIRPRVELHAENCDVIVQIPVPNVDPAALNVRITPNAMLVTYLPPAGGPEVFGLVHFQEEIDLEGVEAEYLQETLKVVAPIAENGDYRRWAESVA